MDKREVIYVFIDSQNLNLGIRSLGWQLDFRKFYIFLKNKFRATKIYLFFGYIKKFESLYAKLRSYGYLIIFRPTLLTKNGVKGNVDVEVTLYSSKIFYGEYDKAIFVSGDGDFYSLYKDLLDEKKLKLLIIPSHTSQSFLLKEFESYKYYLDKSKKMLERNGGRGRITRSIYGRVPLVIK